MTTTLAISEQVQSLRDNPSVQGLLATLDGQTRESVLSLLASMSEDILEGVLEAIEKLDRSDASVNTLVALLKGRCDSANLDEHCQEALHALYKAAKEQANRSWDPLL